MQALNVTKRLASRQQNYAILIGTQPRIRLALPYDLASILPYPEFERLPLMKIGSEYPLRDTGLSQWRKLSTEVRRDPTLSFDLHAT